MNIDWVIPCRYIEVHDNLGTLVGAGIDTLWVAGFPSLVSVTMAVRLLATSDELGPGKPHTSRNVVRGPDGDVVADVAQQFEAGGQPDRTDYLAGLILPLVVQFEAKVEGTYSFEHIVDQSSKSIPLHVLLGPR